MGMNIGANGFRTLPNGQPFRFFVETGGEAIDLIPSTEIVAAHLRENLSIDAEMRLTDSAQFTHAWQENLIMSRVAWTFDAMADTEYTTRWLSFGPSAFAHNYMLAKVTGRPTDGDNMIAPPQWIQDGWDLHARFMNAVFGTAEYNALLAEMAQYYYENIPGIPLIEGSMLPIPIANRFGNVPTGGYQICVLMATPVLFVQE